MREPCDAIVCTISATCIKDQPNGYRGLIEAFDLCDGDRQIFYWRMSNKPKQEVIWLYLVIGNKVRWRARILDFQPAGYMEFEDGRCLFAKCWVRLFDFERLPAPQKEMRGFQGFRYFYEHQNYPQQL